MPDVHMSNGLGPSGAHRWIHCTAAPALEAQMPQDNGTVFTAEGTMAHSVCEALLRRELLGEDDGTLDRLQEEELYSPEMLAHAETYRGIVSELYAEALTRSPDPVLVVEQRVDVSAYIPGGFGTADCVIIADGVMDVIDLKYGKGVPVSAEHNEQLMIYGLGALGLFDLAYDVRTVRLTIVQPRLDSVSSWEIYADDLTTWAETVLRPAAAEAGSGNGRYNPGPSTCRFCKARAACEARAEHQLELVRENFDKPGLLEPADLARILPKLDDLAKWCKDVKAYAEDLANAGTEIPGYKLVEGRSVRRIVNTDAASEALTAAGYPDHFKPRELLGLTDLEKLVGKKKLAELLGENIVKPTGAPTLVPVSDKRKPIDKTRYFEKEI